VTQQPEHVIRVVIFISLVLLFIGLEYLFPRRKKVAVSRKLNNVLIHILNTLVSRMLFPAAAVGISFWANEKGLGLLNLIDINLALKSLIAVLILDFFIYWQHVIFHKIPVLWRLHQVHHSDDNYDFTTALRFHPVEIILSFLIKGAIIIAFGLPKEGVLVFEIILNSLAMFNHGNFYIPKRLDKVIRSLFVTPDMHRIHHSVIPSELNTNFGFNLSCWDRLFRSYTQEPASDHETMRIGLSNYSMPDQLTLWKLLVMPFKK